MPMQLPTGHGGLRAASSTGESRPLLRLGDWELMRLVGKGPLARVYQARPAGSPPDRPPGYAVKVLDERQEFDSAAIEVFRREALVGRRVSHPHLVTVLSSHVGDTPYYLVTPWLEGATLAAHIAIARPSVPVVLWIVRQVAEALDALHHAGWMHADVKPSNIFVSRRGHATLLDLGFARRPDELGSVVDRCVVGTIHYIAPEMVTSALRADIRSDIYSLGVTLFELLSGRRPYHGGSLAELARQHCQDQPQDLHRLVPTLPPGVVQLVRAMMAKEPLRRPQTPLELIERLVALEIDLFDDRPEVLSEAAA